MKIRGILSGLAVGLGSLLFFSEVALASGLLPPNCRGGTRELMYNAGLSAGRSIVRQAWNAVDDCNEVERFQMLVQDTLNRLQLPRRPSDIVACRFGGFYDGALDELATLYDTCVEICSMDGIIIGELMAQAYCDLSIALGGLAPADRFIRGPVEICSLLFQEFCDAAFVEFAATYVQPFPPGESCAPFADPMGEFGEVFLENMNNSCAGNPIIPEESFEPQGLFEDDDDNN